MKLTSKGQVTIAKHLRKRYGLTPETELVFEEAAGGVLIKPAATGRIKRLQAAIRKSKGTAAVASTPEVVPLTRGEDWTCFCSTPTSSSTSSPTIPTGASGQPPRCSLRWRSLNSRSIQSFTLNWRSLTAALRHWKRHCDLGLLCDCRCLMKPAFSPLRRFVFIANAA